MAITLEIVIAQNFMINHFSFIFLTGFKIIFCHSLGYRNFPPTPTKQPTKFLKEHLFDRIPSKFAGILEQLPSTYMKNLVMMGLVVFADNMGLVAVPLLSKTV